MSEKVPKKIVDKNGKHTTVYVKSQSSGKIDRIVPQNAPPIVGYETIDIRDTYEERATNLVNTLFSAARHASDKSNDDDLSRHLFDIGHDVVALMSEMHLKIQRQREEIELLQQGRLMNYSQFVDSHSNYFFGTKLERFKDASGKEHLVIPNGVAIGSVSMDDADLTKFRKAVSEYNSILAALESYISKE